MWGGVRLHSPVPHRGRVPSLCWPSPHPTGCGPHQAPGSHRASACAPLPSSPCSAEAKGNREVWDNQSDRTLNGSVCQMKQESTKPSRHRRPAPSTATPARQKFPNDDRAGVKSVTRRPMSMQPSHPSVVKQRAAASKEKGRHPGTVVCPGHSTPGSTAGDPGPGLPLGGKAGPLLSHPAPGARGVGSGGSPGSRSASHTRGHVPQGGTCSSAWLLLALGFLTSRDRRLLLFILLPSAVLGLFLYYYQMH